LLHRKCVILKCSVKYYVYSTTTFFTWLTASLSRLHDHARTNHTPQDPYGRVISPSHRPVPDNIQHSQEADLDARGGIRTGILTMRAAADPRLSPPVIGIGTFYTVAYCCVIRVKDSVTTSLLGIYPCLRTIKTPPFESWLCFRLQV